jgi:hypothetical protein
VTVETAGARVRTGPSIALPRLPVRDCAVVFVLALATRLGVIYANRGSFFDGAGYDASVYYAAADSLVHGRLPYRDFTMLHPPLLMVLLSPLALAGRLTTDRTGFELASALSLSVGSANAALVAGIARRTGAHRAAAVAAGLLYAVTLLSARDEISSRLEDFGNFFVLLGLWGYGTSAVRAGPRMSVLTGASLAAATSVKIWYAVPLVLVLLWHLVDRRPWRSLRWVAAGAAGAGIAINAPFLVLAGRSMWRMVVVDQFGRSRVAPVLSRISDLDLLDRLRPHSSTRVELACAVVAALVLAIGLATACRSRSGRLPAALLAAELAVLFAAPAYFSSYSDYVMPAACLCAAAAASTAPGARRARRRTRLGCAWLLVAAAALIAVRVELITPPTVLAPSPDRYLQRAAASFRCVQSDSPQPLIALNVLSADLAHGCPQWVDVSGRTYDADRPATSLPRRRNRRWQRDLLRYLRAGQAYVVVDVRREGLSPRTLALLRTARPVARGDQLVLRVVPAGRSRLPRKA